MLISTGGPSWVRAEQDRPISLQIALAALRSLLGFVFVLAGADILIQRGLFAEQFAHWGLPAPGTFSLAIGATEVVCGVLLAVGALTRPVALLLATIMVGAFFTANCGEDASDWTER